MPLNHLASCIAKFANQRIKLIKPKYEPLC